MPSEDGPIMCSREQDLVDPVVAERHDICFVGLFGNGAFGIHLRPILVPVDADDVFCGIAAAFFTAIVTPDTDTLVPSNSHEVGILHVVGVLVFCRWFKHAAEASHFLVDLLGRFDFGADGALTLHHLEDLTVRKVPDTAVTSLGGRNHTSLGRVEAPSR